MNKILDVNELINGRYTVNSFLAEGGMQEVYVCHDRLLNKKVALKTPKNISAKKRFRRSAVVSAKVNHANVAKVIDYVEEKGRFFLVEEFIEGHSLDVLLANFFNIFDPFLLAQFGHHVSRAVAASHHVGVLHRDLKPGNILVEEVTGCYVFKVTDFGIAKLAETEFEDAWQDEGTISSSSTVMGAIPYMSPEMTESPEKATKASDVWAVGAILFALMFGRPPFGRGIPAIRKISEAVFPDVKIPYPHLLQFKPLNEQLLSIIKSCLNKDPNGRPTADSLVEVFSQLCYATAPRQFGAVTSYGSGTGTWGFINQDVFFHRDSFYGDINAIEEKNRVQFSLHKDQGNRVHPVLQLK